MTRLNSQEDCLNLILRLGFKHSKLSSLNPSAEFCYQKIQKLAIHREILT